MLYNANKVQKWLGKKVSLCERNLKLFMLDEGLFSYLLFTKQQPTLRLCEVSVPAPFEKKSLILFNTLISFFNSHTYFPFSIKFNFIYLTPVYFYQFNRKRDTYKY